MKNGLVIKKKEFFTLSGLITFLFICIFWMNDVPAVLGWFGIVITISGIVLWHSKTGESWFCPFSIFSFFFAIFNFGQPMMWALNFHKSNEIGTKVLFYGSGYTPYSKDLIDVQFYVCLAMMLFNLGAYFFAKPNHIYMDCVEEINMATVRVKILMRKVGGVLLLFVTPVALYSKVKDLIVARSFGYGALYYGTTNTQTGYIQIIMFLFFPAIVCYLIGADFSRRSRRISYTVFGIYTVLGALSGERGDWLYCLVILVWLNTFYYSVPIRTYIKYIVLAIVGISAVSVITNARNSGLAFSIDEFINSFSLENSVIVSGIFEMGGSMGIITYLLHSGNGIYPYGNTYLTAIFGAVSSRVLGVLGIKQVLVADWFSQVYLGLKNWGVGFSMIGEAYINGGYIGGFVYMVLLGIIIGKILQTFSHNNTNVTQPIKLFVSAAGLNILIGFVRGALYLTLKEFFYGVFLIVIIVKFLSRREKV